MVKSRWAPFAHCKASIAAGFAQVCRHGQQWPWAKVGKRRPPALNHRPASSLLVPEMASLLPAWLILGPWLTNLPLTSAPPLNSGGIHWNSIQNPAESIGIPFRIRWNPLEFHSESSGIHWNLRFLPFQRTPDGIPTFYGSPPELMGEGKVLQFGQKLFDAMDPYNLKILKDNDRAVPIIKIVFALAAKKPSLKVVRKNASASYQAIIYEIWCAGLSPEVLHPVKEKGVWEALLQASYGWKALYATPSDVAKKLRQSATPGATQEDGHYSCWATRED
ncbi:uncharacterized protein LACBIDRAFT_326243 [Laccaria bicolor S238N-H82]|uniref:Predicted protein n=1 Tax=Laccaria bicolor (strain S238N-H82 / ATCC MYA-4686) TaxID=486041 RepID=B0D7S2_LACBS|nr:uncharacterized protein LACBIDRAFT_326243 [Laccaria bicolor S238N-H82]EDR09449.1 predicted protein [Laccaria bicolor S238N-H82]|eukprot:XP_001879798.1 predicted protein [Laccaria bicolor S238N-H82]